MNVVILYLVAFLICRVTCEKFADGEHSFVELDEQWEFLSKFAYSSNGKIKITCNFAKTDESTMPQLRLYQMPVPKWESSVMSLSSCEARTALATESFELSVEDTDTIESEKECFNYYDSIICEIEKSIDGSDEPWVFVVFSYCSQNITLLDVEWTITSTNGNDFLTKEPSLTDQGLFLTYLLFTLIAFFFGVFWFFYKKHVKLNIRTFVPYKVSLLLTTLAFCLICAHFGSLYSTGVRSESLFNAGFLFLLMSSGIIIQASLSAMWSGSTITVHLPRWKTVLAIVISVVYFVTVVAVYTVQYLDVQQIDVYLFEEQDGRYLNWVTCGLCLALWIAYTVPVMMSFNSSDPNILYLRVLYLIISLYLLGIPGSVLVANFNVKLENRKLFALACQGSLHLLNYVYLFFCIRENHTLKSVLHYWKKTLLKSCCCCCPCAKSKSKKSGNKQDGSSGNRSSNCCLKFCPCFSCCPCCGGGVDKTRYSSETDLRKVLVSNRDSQPRDSFDLKIVDMEGKTTPNTIIQSEPVIITNRSTEDSTSPITTLPSVNIPESLPGQEDAQGNANYKVLPWLYHDKPNTDLTPKQRFVNAGVKSAMNVREHGYKAPSHWVNGNYKPFATADNRPIVLYKKPNSNQLHSASTSSVDGKGAANHFPYQGQLSTPSKKFGTSQSADFSPSPVRIIDSPRFSSRRTGSMRAQADNRDPLDQYHEPEEAAAGFNTADYNSSKLRDNKVKQVTMQYRRETFKQNLGTIPTSLLLQRVPSGTVAEDEPSVISKTKVVKAMKAAHPPKLERSRSSLWRMLSNKYSGRALEGDVGDEARVRKAVAAFKSNRRA